ncbi:melanoma-associated antigen 10-like [Octodon degus]|uniref:Melanoma-associated antigen 10-like n=1 Tax=Octodon degus TaxID=10160 RepID=A0A6P3FJU7_OCTDE|nr:melanoma-associated antigen 10-like [Octodon degus]
MSGSPRQPQLEEAQKDQGNGEDRSGPEMLDPPQNPEGASSSPMAMAAAPWNQYHAGFSCSEEQFLFSWQTLPTVESLMGYSINVKMADLLFFLFTKYQKKEITSKEEMLQCIFQGCEEQFPQIFRVISECIYLVFGIDVKKVSPNSHCYILMPALGLSYDGMVPGVQSYPRISILIIILGIIFFEGNRATEDIIWEVLSGMGVFPGVEHPIYGEPRKFVTEDLVNEHYLEYKPVPYTDPPEYEFVWGPRSLIETTKLDVLEFLAKVKDTTPSAFNEWYEEAVREEEARYHIPDPSEWP